MNVAGGFASGPKGPVRYLKGYFDMLVGIFRMAEAWKVKRLIMASTGGVYLGLPGTVNEEQPLPLPSPFPIIAWQKIVEVATSEFAKASGINSICVRLLGMFGPWQDPAGGGLAARLVHAAVRGRPASVEDVMLGRADDGVDLLYIKDVGRAIALLQTAKSFRTTFTT